MRFNHLPQIFACLLISLSSQLVRAEPMLNGIGVHQELGQEVFIGALFSESLSNDADTLINNVQPMRMELKIVTPDGLTTRRFSRMWIEGMAVNSKADALTAQADNMVKFDSLFKGRFLNGDYITFTNTPGKGVDIAVNGVLLGTINDNVFFSMLLSTWIGKIPLSSDYRDSLLKVGDVDAALRSRFNSITPNGGRVADIKEWLEPTPSEAKPVEPPKVETPKEKVAIAKVDVPKLDVPSIEKSTVDTPAPTAQVASSTSAAPTPSVASSAPTRAAAATEAAEDEDDGPALTAQSLLARQFYVSDAIKIIRGKTRYPQRALERNHAGSVRVAVIIDRQGNILGTNILEKSQYDLLNKEALDAVRRATPFPALPAEIAGARFEFTVPMRWALPD